MESETVEAEAAGLIDGPWSRRVAFSLWIGQRAKAARRLPGRRQGKQSASQVKQSKTEAYRNSGRSDVTVHNLFESERFEEGVEGNTCEGAFASLLCVQHLSCASFIDRTGDYWYSHGCAETIGLIHRAIHCPEQHALSCAYRYPQPSHPLQPARCCAGMKSNLQQV